MKLSCLVSVALGSTVAPLGKKRNSLKTIKRNFDSKFITLGEKRFSQFEEIFTRYYENVERIKLLSYGCYCVNLGQWSDQPLTGVYPVDDRDMHCFEFTKERRLDT